MGLPGSSPRRHSIRLQGYDYSQAGAYFVTICTYNRRPIFGEIHDGEMQLNALGRVASAQWLLLAYRFTNLELCECVIMPNHVHGILVIIGRGEASPVRLSRPSNELIKDASPLRPNGTIPGSVGAIIQNFKSVTSRKINAQSGKVKELIWQRNYYEHVIRDERDYQAIYDYILTNPQNWEKDEEYQAQIPV
jgi:REP element-mobilizing transposase RayT